MKATSLLAAAFSVFLCLAGCVQGQDWSLDKYPLQCPPCERIHCSPRKASKLKCKGGTTLGICNCCSVCAKVEGEKCGGKWDYLGKCDAGLTCEREPDSRGMLSRPDSKGICRRSNEQQEEGLPKYCRPKCTPEFCKANPKSICSAYDMAHTKQACQGECQHTSCSACRYIDPEPECQKCDTNDFRCIRRFGKCVRRMECSRNKHPCKMDPKHEVSGGKWMCMVPGCP
ncbi:cysteine-rich motor neuron 1 protein-like [Branchiostoma lanceolatum]|uniref:cysteine-rich motor neuron 1 protein-like n=1 Tax=Branchiostoma lanceolatum TaxID=7740 RepID=UPI00345483E7